MSLRILHVTPYFADAWAYGGIPRLATTLATRLAERGHQVTVCTTDACDRSRRLPPGWSLNRFPELDVRVFPNRSNRLAYGFQLFTPVGFAKHLAEVGHCFDIVHIHGHRHWLEVSAARACRRAGVPYLSAPNGTAPRIERRQAAKQIWDSLWGTRDLLGAAAVLAVSRAERQQLGQLGVAEGRIHVVGNPLDLDEFSPPPERGRFRHRLGLADTPVVAFLGQMTPRKRLDVVVAAFARLRTQGAALVAAGNDMGAGAGAARLATRLGVAGRTHFVGLLEGRSRLELLADADVVVYPSSHEAFGLVPLEALLCGTPAIVADDSGCGEVMSDLDGGQLVPLGDADALAHAVDRVLFSPGDWRARAARGAAVARARFGGPAIAAEIDALYHELLAR